VGDADNDGFSTMRVGDREDDRGASFILPDDCSGTMVTNSGLDDATRGGAAFIPSSGEEDDDSWGTMRISKEEDDDGQRRMLSLVDTKLLSVPSNASETEDWGTMRINKAGDGASLLAKVDVNCVTTGTLEQNFLGQ